MTEPAPCDIHQVPILLQLFLTPEGARDARWVSRFFDAIPRASLANPDPRIFYGPDFFPYLNLHTPPPNQPFQAHCIASALEYLTTHGLGVAVNASEGAQQAEWVFSYGDILAYRMFGAFMPDDPSPAADPLPDYARGVLRRYFTESLQQENPGVLITGTRLAFSVFRDDFETEGQYRGALRTLAWFLPRHYAVVTIAKDSPLIAGFSPL
jgi:hypothetical protein